MTACMTVYSATDKEVFTTYIRDVLLPPLRYCRPGQPEVPQACDRRSTDRKGRRVGRVPAPPYSPSLNPIEKMWNKLKEFLRSAKARTSDALNEAIAAAFLTVSQSDALSWFASCGYTIS